LCIEPLRKGKDLKRGIFTIIIRNRSMNKLLEINRELRDIPDPRASKLFFEKLNNTGSREYYIQKMMTTYGYDRENSEKCFELVKVQRTQYAIGNKFNSKSLAAGIGGLGMLYARPTQKHLEKYNAIFRKPWMKLPIYGITFAFWGYCGLQLPARLFPRLFSNKN
jgi:hypothetical protein